MIDACVGGDVEKVKKLLQESPSLLNEHLNSVFFFFWILVELFHGHFVVLFEGYFLIMFLSLIVSHFFLFLFFFSFF